VNLVTSVLSRLALAALVLAMVAFCASRLTFSTNITNFMPRGHAQDLAAISSKLADSELSRTMILSIGAPQTPVAVAAARELADMLRRHPVVAWVRTGIDAEQIRNVYETYFPRRYSFLSDRPRREIPALLRPEVLRARAAEAKRELAQPTSPFFGELIAADPLGAFRRIVGRIRADRPSLRLEDGQFVSDDGRWAIVFLGTRVSAFESGPQSRLLDDIAAEFAKISKRHGAGLRLEESGANRFAVRSERRIKQDVWVIAACSFAGVAGLFLAFFRSLRGFALAALAPLLGALTATASGLLVFGHLDGLTLAFGTSLIGVAIDYPIHLLNHHRLASPPESPAATVRRLRAPIALGALTTMASFAGLGLTSFPGFQEIAFVAVVGVGAALLVTLYLIPGFLGAARPMPAVSGAVARRLSAGVLALERYRRWLAAIPLACLAVAAIAVPHLRWVDDLTKLANLDPRLLREDQRVRERVSQFDSGRFVIATAATAAGTVALNDRVYERLEEVIRNGHLDGMRSLHAMLWSPALQRESWRVLQDQPDVYRRVLDAFAAEGFRRDAFEPFRAALESPAPPPLTYEDLLRSPLADAASSLVFRLGDRTAAVTYLRGVRSLPAIRDAVAGLKGVYVIDQRAFVNEIYAQFRTTTLEQILVGSILVIVTLAARYRHWRPTLAAFLPSVLVAAILLSAFALLGVPTNLLHAISLMMVMGMGVDYGIFIVDSVRHRGSLAATMLSMLVACLTTVFVFGTLAISDHPALRAIGVTTGLGVLLSFVLAPVTLVLLRNGDTGAS
jgi:predicted exporter